MTTWMPTGVPCQTMRDIPSGRSRSQRAANVLVGQDPARIASEALRPYGKGAPGVPRCGRQGRGIADVLVDQTRARR